MAVTTLKPNINIKNLTAQQKSIKKEVKNVDVVSTKIKSSLFRRNKFKKESISRLKFLQNKRNQQTLRQEREDVIESSGISGATRRVKNIVTESGRGFLGRILDFIGTLLVGWLLNNLPTILTMAKELIARIRRMFSLLTEFVQNLTSTFFNFGQLLGAVYKNVSSFDFFDTSGRVSDALTELQKNFDAMGAQFDEGVKLTTTSLGEGIESGEDAAPTGTDYTVTPGTSGTSGKLQPIHKQALDIISGPESAGSYNAMNQGTINDKIVGSTLSSKGKIGKNLTDMTIGEVLQRQQWLMNKSNPQVSNYGVYAAGRYQFVPNTLPGVMKSAGLTPQDKFSPENQDLMAIALLKQRGIQPWTVGGSKYSEKERAIVEQARKTPLGEVTSSTPGQFQPTQVQPGRVLRSGDKLTGSIGRGVEYIEITDAYNARSGTHKGLDIAAPNGTYIALRYDCEVVAAGWYGDYGYLIDVWVPQLRVQLRMAHLSAILIKSGKIKAGTSFARIGSTGKSSGPHIHFEYDTVRGRSNYGGSGDPSPYVNALLLTKTANKESFSAPPQAAQQIAPSQVQSAPPQTPIPAQIATQTPQRQQQLAQQVTPQRTGQQIVVIDEVQPSAPQMPMAAPSPQQPTIILLDPLNRMMKNKLLLDLAYT